jgi:uncharacterized protein
MQPARSRHQQPGKRGPLAFDTRTLGPGDARSETRTVPAPPDLGAGMISVPEGSDLRLDVQLEGVSEGVLVTATVTAPLAGECARCLDPFSSAVTARFRELFARQDGGRYREGEGDDEEDGYLLRGDLLDLEAALRDALVLELPLSPLCAPDCPGLCSECGIRLADAEPGHHHPRQGAMRAALQGLRAAGSDPQ